MKSFAWLGLVSGLWLLSVGGASAATFELDGDHTSVIFRVTHLGVSPVYGRFNEVSGTVTLDEADVTRSRVSITIQAASVDTHAAKRDKHLRSPDFFSAKECPTIVFESTAVEKTGENTYRVQGDVTCHGVTKPVTAEFEYFGEAQDSQGNTKAGGEARFTIQRSEFGVTYGIPAIGDAVEFVVGLEGYKR